MTPELSDFLQRLHPMIEVDGLTVVGVFAPTADHQGNPGWLHGGMAATVLDHVCARAASASLGGERVVTARLDLRYRQPVSITGGPYRVEATAEPSRGSRARVSGAIVGPDGRPLVSARALFLRRARSIMED